MDKKTDALFRIYGTNRIIQWHFFFKFSLRPFEDNQCRILRLQPPKFWFLLHYLQGNGRIRKIVKTNKSRVWNHLSYRGLFLPFRGEELHVQEQLQNFKVAASKINIDPHLNSTTSKELSENFKKKLRDNPVSPIDAKNSISFFA